MYYGTWSAAVLNDYQAEALRNSKPKQLYISDLNNDIICNTLWYEMSYNTERFGKTSPFISNGKNDILYFNDTYKENMSYNTKDFLPDEIVNLTWNISAFIKTLYKAGLYDKFIATGDLPNCFNISGAKVVDINILSLGTEHRILNHLLEAINAITRQNCLDLNNLVYKDKIIQTVQQRHLTNKRSDISYMMVAEYFNHKEH